MAFGFWMRSRHMKLARLCTAQTTGTVTGFSVEKSTSKDDDGHTHASVYYHPIFEYNAGGRTVTKTSSTGSGKPKFKKGQAVTVRYNPNDVERFVVAEDKSSANFGFYFMMFGALVAAAGVVSIFAQ
jgi:hypothetical protein